MRIIKTNIRIMLKVSNNAILRIKEVQAKDENKDKFLRIAVDSGGCNGFQYIFSLDNNILDNDYQISDDSKIIVATDEISLQFLQNSEIDFIKELGSSYFKVNNPNATSKCGCGSSFST